MQLKKRFSVRKSVAAGAMAVAMFATSMPAMASNGFGLGLDLDARINARIAKDENGENRGRSADAKNLNEQIRAELKSVKEDIRAAVKLSASGTVTASGSTTVEVRKQ